MIKSIQSEEDYDAALLEIERYLENEPARGTAEADRFTALCDAVEAYEDIHWPIDSSPRMKVGM